ncbi:hypothetical protein CEUSTIGMA_g9684.t1 [Chlamydomonas eustigma]|uniref:Magnesium transporter n=1 Tax=Chlamydomonas eustigma TaxID=1157962 RepID=A0A250XGV2_9CHLO|nr:hypothetical protein CEUSTIGMA_g9684.t1 [Chlamydomonas eustigma]|eukprot:GAX82256.1 hypothetical protein CEUSTIGMA_g9684.t1 [Chlamydomonas eustigma]
MSTATPGYNSQPGSFTTRRILHSENDSTGSNNNSFTGAPSRFGPQAVVRGNVSVTSHADTKRRLSSRYDPHNLPQQRTSNGGASHQRRASSGAMSSSDSISNLIEVSSESTRTRPKLDPKAYDSDTSEASFKRRNRRRHQKDEQDVKPAIFQAGARKGVAAKALTMWVRMWPVGDSGLLNVEKSALINSLGIQPRDFRIMDTAAARQVYCVMSRDKCIIVHMAHIRCIITTQYVLLVPPDDDKSAIFLTKLKERISQPHAMVGRSVLAFLGERPHPPQSQSSRVLAEETGGPASSQGRKNRPWGKRQQQQQQHNAVAIRELMTGGEEEGGFNMDLTFELKALEICLDELASDVEERTTEIELALKPAIDRLATNVRTDTLDMMRRLKTKLVTLTSTTHTICRALEELLEDEDDMLDMNLTAKEQREMQLLTRISTAIEEGSEEGYASDDSDSSNQSVQISKVEMLIEAYFMHFDSIFNRLQDLMDNISDTEVVVNIKLDAHQNKLLGVNLIFQGIHGINYMAIGIGGFLTMNLLPSGWLLENWAGGGSAPPGGQPPGLGLYLAYCMTAVIGSYIIFFVVIFIFIRKGMLQF